MRPDLVVDIGNTRIKWGVFAHHKWNPCGALPTAEANHRLLMLAWIAYLGDRLGRLKLRSHVRSTGLRPMNVLNLAQYILNAAKSATKPPRMSWMAMLPVPGSRYPCTGP